MPRRHTLPPQQIRIKTDKLSSPPSPFKNILPDNNEKKIENAGGKELDGGRYLHKKFKKVATLEDAPVVAACGGDASNRVSSEGTVPECDGAVAPAQGRYVCPYCAMACAKPSVLQKHIRAHTNERPYPCRPCGFAFKTKSNLYKHCRSRAHTLKMDVADCSSNPSSEEEETRQFSISPSEAEDEVRLSFKNKIYKPKFHTLQGDSPEEHDSSPPSSPDFLRHKINRLISDSESVLDQPVHPQWCPPRSSNQKDESPEAASPFPSKLALALLRPAPTSSELQPLNLSQKEPGDVGAGNGDPVHTDGSIVKDILLQRISRSGLNGYKENTVSGVECPDCKLIVDKLDVHLRVGCQAQLEVNLVSSVDHNSSNTSLAVTRVTDYPVVPGRHTELPPIVRTHDVVLQPRSAEPPPLLHCNSLRRDGPPDLTPSLSRTTVDPVRPLDVPPALMRISDGPSANRIASSSPGLNKGPDIPPALGRTPLIEPAEKRRRISPKPSRLPDLIPPMDSSQKSVRLFGGKVKILDGPGGEAKTLRIDSGCESPPRQESQDPKDRRVLTIAKTGLHSVGLTVIQSDCQPQRKSSDSLNGKIVIPILSNIPRNLDPLTSITAYNPLTLPPRSSELVQPLTIVHGGKAIPHVPGIPGPNSLLDPSLVRKPPDTPTADSPEPDSPVSPQPLIISTEENSKPTYSISGALTVTTSSLPPSTPSSEVSEKKFVRPTWLPLKAGTFVAKKPLGALGLGPPPVALVSPETPRPRKSYGQLYLNGHAYTYLGLKCSSRMFFCTLNKPQPIYVPLSPEHATLSMYSNWKVVSESALSPLGLSPVCVMTSYDSRNRCYHYSQAGSSKCQVKHSSYSLVQPTTSSQPLSTPVVLPKGSQTSEDEDPKRLKICNGGYESTEDYVYIRGRGRGRYVCEECGVRCSKPSMLKKHIRTTHSDLRPYSCKYCSFSFKTKGNLTKHMKSKAHYKQCLDLDINPVPLIVDESNINKESLARQNALCKELGGDMEGSSEETEEEDEEDDGPDSDDEESRMDREAAASLLSLSEVAQQSALQDYANLGLISTSSRPLTYPYSTPSVIRSKSSASDRQETLDQPLELTSSSQSNLSDITTPIDLSNKNTTEATSRVLENEANVMSVLGTPIAALSALSPVLPSPLGTPSVISDEGCALMTVYLKEKAARDTLMKQQQYRHNSSSSVRLTMTEERRQPVEIPIIVVSSENSRSPLTVACSTIDSRPVDSHQYDNHPSIRPIEARLLVDNSRPVVDSAPNDRTVENNKNESLFRPVENHRSSDSQDGFYLPGESGIKFIDKGRSDVHDNISVSEPMDVDVESTVEEKKSEESQAAVSVSFNHSAKESALGILALTSSQAAKAPSSILPPPQSKLKAEFLPPSSGPNYMTVIEEGKSVCGICQKVFTKPSQLRLHVNIHYFERPFRCDSCGVSFRTKGHLQKHQRSISHLTKVNMNSTFGPATMSNPRPFKCTDCKIAFRIHGHLAKHLRSKMHIMRLECLGKLPFGMYAELERSGLNIHDIDTTDCHNSLSSLQLLAQKLHEKDPSKLGQWAAPVDEGQGDMGGGAEMPASAGETSSDEDEPASASLTTLSTSQTCTR